MTSLCLLTNEIEDREVLSLNFENTHKQEFEKRQTFIFAKELEEKGRLVEARKFYNKFLEENSGWIEDKIESCYRIGICHNLLKEYDKAVLSFIKSLIFYSPRAENCCEIGYYFMRKEKYNIAVFWFEIVFDLHKPVRYGFKIEDYWNFIPSIELALCYFYLNNFEKALRYFEAAKKIKPNSQNVLNLEMLLNK